MIRNLCRVPLAVLGLSCFFVPTYAGEAVAVSDSRPLRVLVKQLRIQSGYPITYEEAPYGSGDITTEVWPNGISHHSLRNVSMVFHVPPLSSQGARDSLSAAGPVAARSLLDIVGTAVDEHNRSGNPGKFAVLGEGGYLHVVPAPDTGFQPMLDTHITLAANGSCLEAYRNFLAQVGSLRSIPIVGAITPVGMLSRSMCSINVVNAPARGVLLDILAQTMTGIQSYTKNPNRYAWALLYDVQTKQYFMSVTSVKSPGRSANDSSTSASGEPTNVPPARTNSELSSWAAGRKEH